MAGIANLFALIDQLKRNVGRNLQDPIGAVELGLLRADEDFKADPVNAVLGNANIGGGLLGTFVGPNSKVWNKVAANTFENLEKKGIGNKEAYFQTGTFRSPDGRLRQEIDDSAAKIIAKPDERAKQLTGRNEFYGAGGGMGGLFQSVDHPLLKQAYPKFDTSISPLIRFGDDIAEEGSLDDYGRLVVRAPNEQGARSVALHELQHAVQQKEKFARGGSPEEMSAEIKLGYPEEVIKEARILRMFLDSDQAQNPRQAAKMYESLFGKTPNPDAPKLASEFSVKTLDADLAMNPKSAFDRYQRLAGEAEARATQSRMNMSADERRKSFPLDSYDVPINELIIRGLLD